MDKFNGIIEVTAAVDLRGILRYIGETLKEPEAAKRIYFSIKDKINTLDQLPQRQPFVRDEVLASRGVRRLPVENYSVFYVVDESARKVSILRILHNRREWQNII